MISVVVHHRQLCNDCIGLLYLFPSLTFFWSLELMQVHRPMNQVLSSLVDQEVGNQVDNPNIGPDDLHQTYTVDEFEVRILEPEKSGGPWVTKATIPMQNSENALTVRVVILLVSQN